MDIVSFITQFGVLGGVCVYTLLMYQKNTEKLHELAEKYSAISANMCNKIDNLIAHIEAQQTRRRASDYVHKANGGNGGDLQ